jgi:hypothetical protein
MSINQKKKTTVNLIIYRQLQANEILVDNGKWKKLNESFADTPHGIYFYTFGKDAHVPFYIGMCKAKTYNIVGRVWDELNDYSEGIYWLPKNVSMLKNLDCFKESTRQKKEGLFYPPKENSNITNEQKKAINKFMNSVFITFGRIEPEKDVLLKQVEAKLQKHIVNKLKLEPTWIGDAGQNLTGVSKKGKEGLSIIFKNETGKKINFLDVFEDI